MKLLHLSLFFFLFLLTACKENTEIIAAVNGDAYYPLEVGQIKIYQVDSILYYNGSRQDSIRSYIREVITAETMDATGMPVVNIERSTRRNLDASWQFTDVVIASKDVEGAYRTENNRRLQKLVFPLVDERRWRPTKAFDENEFYTIPGGEEMQVYRYWQNEVIAIDSTLSLDGIPFTDLVVVAMPIDTADRLELRYAEEFYAEDIGLIKSTLAVLEDQLQQDTFWHVKAQKGFIVRQELIDF